MFAARSMDLIKIWSDTQMKVVADAVQEYHEQVLGLTRDDLKLKCPPAEVLERLLHNSLEVEKFFPPERSENDLISDFEKMETPKLCEVDVKAALEDSKWVTFFQSWVTPENVSSPIL